MEPTGPMMEAGFSFWQFLMLVIYVVLLCYPIGKVLSRVGFSGWRALLAIVPVINLIALWIFAFADWPRLPKRPSGEIL